jgi:hypothetical protein
VSEPAQRLLQLHALVLADPVDGRDRALVRLDDPLLQREQRLQVALDRLGQAFEDTGEPTPQRRRVVLGAVGPQVVLDVVEPAQQRLLLGDRQVGVDLRALLLGDLPGGARVAEPVGLDLDPVAVALDALVVLREDDLLGHRGQVDLVGLLVEVVLLGEVLGVEVVADVHRLAVAVPLLRVSLGSSESVKSSSAPVSERSSWPCPWPWPASVGPTFTSAKNRSKTSSNTSSSRRSLISATRRAALRWALSASMPGSRAQAIASRASGIEIRICRSRSRRTNRCSAFSISPPSVPWT